MASDLIIVAIIINIALYVHLLSRLGAIYDLILGGAIEIAVNVSMKEIEKKELEKEMEDY